MLFEMIGAKMISDAIKMSEMFKPREQATEPKMIKQGNWERRVVPVPANEKLNEEG